MCYAIRETSLHATCPGHGNRYYDACAFLIKLGANIDSRDEDGDSVLHLVVARGLHNTVLLLLENGASVQAQNYVGITPLHQAAEFNRSDIARTLLLKGADPNSIDRNERTPLSRASYHGYVEVLEALLQGGASFKGRDNVGFSALHWAALGGQADAAELLTSPLIGHPLEVRDGRGWSPLHLAANRGAARTVGSLASAGADLTSVTNDGQTALHLARTNGHKNTIALLEHISLNGPRVTSGHDVGDGKGSAVSRVEQGQDTTQNPFNTEPAQEDKAKCTGK
jgi:ankyrin repeat protein